MSDNIITIDGPSGVGKGTLAYWLADKLGWVLLDSGLIYRYFAWLALEQNVAIDDEERLATLTHNCDFHFENIDGSVHLIHEGRDITDALRNETIAEAASTYSKIPLVRNQLKGLQRAQKNEKGLVADGRDMGTVIFPEAPLKIFLTASVETRAKRRFKQLKDKGSSDTLAALSQAIRERDERDANRAVSPLIPADDAVIIDTSDLSVEEVQQKVWELVNERFDVTSS